MPIYLWPNHYSTQPVRPGGLWRPEGEQKWQQFRKLTPSLFQLSFYLEPLSFTPPLAGSWGLDMALSLAELKEFTDSSLLL